MTTALSHAAIGAAITRGDLSLFPIYLNQPDPGVVTGSSERILVSERPGAEVPTLVVTNPGAEAALIAEGETLVGGWQNRVVNVSVLVPAESEIDLPVTCVEAGRWGGGREFSARGAKAPRRVRRHASASVTNSVRRGSGRMADQGAVWSAVDHELMSLGVASSTRAVADLAGLEARDHRLGEAVAELVELGPLPNQCGVVVAHGRRPVALEVFGSEQLLRDAWEQLVRGFMFEARGRVDGRPSATKALEMLARFDRGIFDVGPGVGLGAEMRVSSPRITGQALVLNDLMVHASAFALA